ncbi:MAG: leucine-rich repeat domain-containing protein [Treponema sp.]|jgi:hypothetical protein|nr:leucine-rich repeat domain-containing protein [Treponema sp.]
MEAFWFLGELFFINWEFAMKSKIHHFTFLVLLFCVGFNAFTRDNGIDLVTDFTTESAEPLAVHGDFVLRGAALVSYTGKSTNVVIPANLGVRLILDDAFAHSPVVTVVIPEGVQELGYGAFASCEHLTSITIPNSVTKMGAKIFLECSSLISITIPNGVTIIGDKAFDDCISLASIIIPNSVTTIGDGAFFGCRNLTVIFIPSSVITIGDSAFAYCNKLSEIRVDDRNTYYSSVNGILFNKSKTELVQYPSGMESTVYVIPNTVTTIRSGAFSSCDYITSITIPVSVIAIGSYVFPGCRNLRTISLSRKTKIDRYAFIYIDPAPVIHYYD